MGKIISIGKAKKISCDWYGGRDYVLYQFASSGEIIEKNYTRYLSEINLILSLDIEKYQLKKTKIKELKQLQRYFEFKIERKELIHHL